MAMAAASMQSKTYKTQEIHYLNALKSLPHPWMRLNFASQRPYGDCAYGDLKDPTFEHFFFNPDCVLDILSKISASIMHFFTINMYEKLLNIQKKVFLWIYEVK